ncbi:MAG: TonB-dependent receptor [Bacteroidetes bacterium]|nr:TonB-dependent receptor [Bacteroidota bacterium]
MKQKLYLKLFFIVVFLFNGSLFAQNIAGIVSDSNGGLPGVTVIIKGTTQGTTTDINGNYSISGVSAESTLVFSFIGMKTQEVQVAGKTSINITMLEDLADIDEVIVVGYTSRKKSTVIGAMSVIDVTGLEKSRSSNVGQALQGQVAGVQVTQSDGSPGAEPQIRVRGIGTIGSNEPLYIVDGVPTLSISFLNGHDIKSMSILKDAAAAAIYGSRASAGVVLITTKSGSKGETSVNVNYYHSISNATNLPTMLNAGQYMNTAEKAWNNTFTGSNPYTADKDRSDFGDTNYLDELFEGGSADNLNVSISGGSEKSKYFMSLAYHGEDGIVVYDNDKYKKLNFRSNFSTELSDRLKVGANISATQRTINRVASKGESLIRFALLRAPVIPLYKNSNDPTYSEADPFTDMPFYTATGYDQGLNRTMYEMVGNPIAQAYFSNDQTQIFRTFSNIHGSYSFLDDKELTFNTNVGINLAFAHDKAFNQNYGDDDGSGSEIDKGLGRRNRPNNLSEGRVESLGLTYTNTLSYNKTFAEKHDFSAMVGTEYILENESNVFGSRSRFGYASEEFQYLDYGGSSLDVWNGGTKSENALFSYFGSANYTLNNKYLFGATFRADASSKFAEKHRWGYFPSVSAGWKISSEDFFAGVDWISSLKMRASWGQLGNQNIANYTFAELIEQNQGIVRKVRYGNPDLKWETTTITNVGFDLALSNNKVQFALDYFDKTTTDILLPVGLPGFVGDVDPTFVNAGEVSNKGFEFAVNYRNRDNEFKYSIDANIATVINKVEKLHPNVPSIVENESRIVVGQSISSYYGYNMEGVYQDQSEIDAHLTGSNAKPGDIRFKDLDGNKVINSLDREIIGSYIPDLTYGLSFNGQYKKFDFSVFVQGVEGVDRYNDGKKIVDYDTRPFNYTTAVLDAWDGKGSSNTVPRVAFDDNGSSKVSSLFVEDASYLRLKNVEIGYTLDNIKGVGNIRLYISGKNLITSTDYTGLDPETTDLVDKGTYPSAASVFFGVDFKF